MAHMSALLSFLSASLTPADVIAFAAVALVAMAIILAVRIVRSMPSEPARVPVRVRARRDADRRPRGQFDPDAAGRPRPRAPGSGPAA
jgi:hypothetical protein